MIQLSLVTLVVEPHRAPPSLVFLSPTGLPPQLCCKVTLLASITQRRSLKLGGRPRSALNLPRRRHAHMVADSIAVALPQRHSRSCLQAYDGGRWWPLRHDRSVPYDQPIYSLCAPTMRNSSICGIVHHVHHWKAFYMWHKKSSCILGRCLWRSIKDSMC